MRFPLFLTVVLLVLAAACAYMGGRTLALSPAAAAHPALVWAVLALFVGLLFGVSALGRVRALRPWRPFLTALSYGLFGFMATYLLYLAAADLSRPWPERWPGIRAGPWPGAPGGGGRPGLGAGGPGHGPAPGLGAARGGARRGTCRRGWTASASCRSRTCTWGPLVRRAQVDHILAATALWPRTWWR